MQLQINWTPINGDFSTIKYFLESQTTIRNPFVDWFPLKSVNTVVTSKHSSIQTRAQLMRLKQDYPLDQPMADAASLFTILFVEIRRHA